MLSLASSNTNRAAPRRMDTAGDTPPRRTLASRMTFNYGKKKAVKEPLSVFDKYPGLRARSLILAENELSFVEDVDHEDQDNPLACPDLAKSIAQFDRDQELQFRFNPEYMKLQPYINPGMRTILHNWMVQVHDRFDLRTEALWIAISLMDRFVSTTKVGRTKYQLVGLTCLFVAAKYEQIYPPSLKQFLYMANDEYPKDQVLKMELLLLSRVKYLIQAPTPFTFLKRYNKVAQLDKEQSLFAAYLIELSLLKSECLCYLPSTIAAAAVFLTLHVLPFDDLIEGEQVWGPTLKSNTDHSPQSLKPVVLILANLHRKVSQQSLGWDFNATTEEPYYAIHRKYARERYMRVSLFAIPAKLGGMKSGLSPITDCQFPVRVITSPNGEIVSTRPGLTLNVENNVPSWLKRNDEMETRRNSHKNTGPDYDKKGGMRYFDRDWMEDEPDS